MSIFRSVLGNRKKVKTTKPTPTSRGTTPTLKRVPVSWEESKYAKSYKVINSAFAAMTSYATKDEFYGEVENLGPGKVEMKIFFSSSQPISPAITEFWIESQLIEGFRQMLNAAIQKEELFADARKVYNSWAKYLAPKKVIDCKIAMDDLNLKEMYETFVGFLKDPETPYII